MFTFLLVVQIIVSISIISLVMLQQGKGADMGAAFGSGASGTVFGARGSGSFFSRATAILAAVFFINCLLIASPLVRDTVDVKASVAEKIEQQQAATQEAGEQEKVMQSLKKLEDEGAPKQPMDIPALAEPASKSEVPDVSGAAATAEKPGQTPGPDAKPGGTSDLPE